MSCSSSVVACESGSFPGFLLPWGQLHFMVRPGSILRSTHATLPQIAGLEFGLRPAMHKALGLQPLQGSAYVSGSQQPPSTATNTPSSGASLDGFDVKQGGTTEEIQWTDPMHSSKDTLDNGDVSYDWRRGSGVAGVDTAADDGSAEAATATPAAPAPYYPPLVGTQIAAGTVAASAVAFNMLRSGGAGGFARFAMYCLMGGLAGSLVPSYEDSMARKYK